MAQCITCGSELHPDRAKKYNYCMAPECQEKNLKGLVLDLRENPGGLLNEGVATAGHFLRKGEVVVSHRGRNSAEKPYLARGSALGGNYPIVVLVNRYSASAAEIVSGAICGFNRISSK